jgi:hypothetical protein
VCHEAINLNFHTQILYYTGAAVATPVKEQEFTILFVIGYAAQLQPSEVPQFRQHAQVPVTLTFELPHSVQVK